MLQWLWRVADEEQPLACEVPLVLRMRVVNAIASMSHSDDAWVRPPLLHLMPHPPPPFHSPVWHPWCCW